jgi:hypothetical protein
VPGPTQNRFSLQLFSFATHKIAYIADIAEQGPDYILAVLPGPEAASRSILYEQERARSTGI